MDEASLQNDLDALVRVRNRLVHAPDSALPKILSGLLPRILGRLESNHAARQPSCPTERPLLLLDHAQAQLTAILSHSIERIRAGRHTILSGAPWILPLLLQTNDLQSPVANTFRLLILQHSIPLHANYLEDVQYSSKTFIHKTTTSQPEELISILPDLTNIVHKCHQQIIVNSSNNNPPKESLLLHYRTSSWICLDVVALSWGLPALIDWGHEYFDDDYEWSTPTTAREAFLEHGPSRHARHNINQSSPIQNTGAFQLWLDLFLFWPADDKSDNSMMSRRRRIVRTEAEIMVENSTGMTPEGIRRMNHRRKDGQPWNVRYLRELKLACMEYIVVAPIREEMLQNQSSSSSLLSLANNLPFLRCVILCILTASPGSMHGKIAMDFAEKVGQMMMAGSNDMASCQSQASAPREAAMGSTTCSENDGSLLLACALMTLVLGSQSSCAALARHRETKEQMEAIMGPLLCRGEAADTSTINDAAPELPLERGPVPFDVAEYVIEFILNRLLPPAEVPSRRWIGTAGYHSLLPAFVDLVVALSKSKGAIGSYFAIQLLDRLYGHHLLEATSNGDQNAYVHTFCYTCIDVAAQVLSQIAEVDAETRLTMGEIQHTPEQALLPGGVHQPFPGRRDLNLMLVRHRNSQKRKQLKADCALEARTTAYAMVAQLAPLVGVPEPDPMDSTKHKKQSPMLELPIILLKCAAFEEYTCMRPHVTKALDSVLAVYRKSLDTVDRPKLETRVASLLPSLLCAVCSDASAARLSAVRWVIDFVRPLDPGVAWHVCSFLADDADSSVSSVASQGLRFINANPPVSDRLPSYPIQLLSTENDEDRVSIRGELESLVANTAASLDTPINVTRVLLSHFKFARTELTKAWNVDRASVLSRCGVLYRANQDVPMTDEDSMVITSSCNKTCGICYDVFRAEDGYDMCCGHPFCKRCWQGYLACALDDRPVTSTAPVLVSCPEQECEERVLSEDVKEVAPELLCRWNNCVLQSFVAGSKSFCFCPGPDCPVVAQLMASEDQATNLRTNPSVNCGACATSFCFSCGSDPHQPAHCADFAEWNRIFGSSEYWVKKNAKPCPNCNVPIEKNNGCNHMRCRMCRHDFCWLCLTALGSHLEPHICNRYESHQSAENDDERRALFFTDRFQAHEDAEKFASREAKCFDEKREKLAAEILWFASDDDLDNMYTAARTLVRARNFLKNSYVAAWAMRKDLEHRDVFESHQANLELFTEKLSQLLLTKVHQLYIEHGAGAIHMHFRAMIFSTGSLLKYMDRMIEFMSAT
ncbi:IBR domain-containing protein 1 [Seminavis robusta]|uniref:RBR-type E3 ubiquitin transferase n=1 Tax=Seminavis robusta TaxID=568900 RepID=A0A9N8EKW1_9STRA|nr:IBR domain-containing protein 1 [Seminavis robusta]|eukprot:Sro1131_g244690.1 IBR domain-containing protein 1 (1277) ;mRNA; f:27765-31595